MPALVQEVSDILSGAQQKAVFILTELGYDNQEIGDILGIPTNTVRSVKSTVRKRIISQIPDLKERGDALSIFRQSEKKLKSKL